MASIFQREYKRKDGTTYKKWCGKVTKNYKTKTFYADTKKDLEKLIRDFENDIEQYGKELKKTSNTLSALMYDHLFINVHPTVQKSTFERYMGLYTNHIEKSKLGKKKITDIKHSDIQKFFNEKVKKIGDEKNPDKLVPKSLGNIRFLLKQTFQFAIKENLIRDNPCTDIKLPTTDLQEKEIQILTIEEQKKYMEVTSSTKYRLLFLTALFTGMRMGELIALKWCNVDLSNGVISVRESYKRTKSFDAEGNSENIIDKKAPKTRNGIREIHMPTFLINELKQYKKKNISNIDGLVFTTSTGQQMSDANIRRIQIALCKKAEIEYKNFHALRHTYATRLIENGTDIKTVSRLLGHADIQTTLNIYVHSTDDSKKSVANILDQQFKNIL